MIRSHSARLAFAAVLSLVAVGCYKSTIDLGGTDGGVADSGRDAGDVGPDTRDTGGGGRCGGDVCAMGEVCCPGCTPGEGRCVGGGFGCPDILCPEVIRSCEDAEVRGYPGAPCEGDFACGYGDACCTTDIFCAGGALEMNTVCAPGCGMGEVAYVIDRLAIATADPAGDPRVVAGMNLDGLVSDVEDPRSCFHVDYISPPPDSERGVDNQLTPLVTALGSDVGLGYAESIARGDLLLVLLRIEPGPGGPIELWWAETTDGRPPRLRRGTLRPNQEFQLLEPIGFFFDEGDGARTRARGDRIQFPIFSTETLVNLFPAALYGTFSDTGVSDGVLGGGFDPYEGAQALVALDPDVIPLDLARSVLEAQADLTGPGGRECTLVSGAWTFTAVPARVYR